jgi:GNAT superfamily N-acetyltransferase
MKLRYLGADAVYHFRHGGFTQATRWLIEVFRTMPYNHIEWVVLARSLEAPLPSFNPGLPLTFRIAGPDELSLLNDLVPPSELTYFRRRLSHGRSCCIATYEQDIVGYGWVTAEVDYDIDNLELHLGDGDVYQDDLFTAPAYRGHGIGRALDKERLEYMRERGFNRAVKIVRIDNVPALKLSKANGWLEVDRMTFRRLLFWRKYQYHRCLF